MGTASQRRLSAHFHKYGDVCCGRCAHGFKALRRVDTGYRRGGATKKMGAQRRNPLGGGGLWSISSSLVVDDVPTSPPSRSSTSPHKPPPQISPYLWKGALRQRYVHIEWRVMAGMRDRLIHGYFGVDYDIVWDVAVSEAPDLQREIEKINRFHPYPFPNPWNSAPPGMGSR